MPPVQLTSLWRCAAAAVALMLSSCQVVPVVHLLNMSGHDVRVGVLDEEIPLLDGQEIEIEYPYPANGGMLIRYGKCSLSYMPPNLPPPPSEFMRYRFFRPHLNARVERDWSIVVLEPLEATGAAPPIKKQPEGFPLFPGRSGGCE